MYISSQVSLYLTNCNFKKTIERLIFNSYCHLGLSIQSSLSAFFLSVFSFKFTLEAQKLKDEIFTLYYQKDQASKQWIEIFERLPVGVLLVNNDKIVHFNENITQMLGDANIRKDQNITDFNLEIQTNYGLNSPSKNGNIGGESATHTSTSSFEIRQPFANFLQGIGSTSVTTKKDGENLQKSQDDQTEVRIGSKIISCIRREIEFKS